MNGFKSTTDFLTAYKSVDLWNELVKYARPAQKATLKSLEKNKGYINNQLLALLARMQWYKQGYFEVQNALNPQLTNMLP